MIKALDPGKAARANAGIPVVPAIDGFRAISIAAIVVFHVFIVSGVLASAGDSAGAIVSWGLLPIAPLTALFIVSGFVLFLPTAARDGEFGSVVAFALRRAARLLPAYWVALVVALVALAVAAAPADDVPGLGPIATHVTMLQTPALLVEDGFALGFGVIAPVWTLSVEIGFCVVLPFVASAYFRRPLVGLAIAAAILVGWHELAVNAGDVAATLGLDLGEGAEARLAENYASQLPSWGLAFAVGMTGAQAFVSLRRRYAPAQLVRVAAAVLAASLPALALLVYVSGKASVDDPDPFNGLFARQTLAISLAYPLVLGAAMIAVTLGPRRVQLPFTIAPIRRLAEMSYGIYLIHFAVIFVALRELSLSQSGSIGAFVAWSALVFGLSVPYGLFSALAIEFPVRRWARRLTRRLQERHAAAAVTAETPLVSIVIPTLNRPEWLRGAIDSVLAQDHPAVELIVVDDGSTGETHELLERVGANEPPSRFRHVRQENAGQAVALNRGNAMARGDFIGYLSDDDFLEPSAVSRLAGALRVDPDASVAYPGYKLIDARGTVEDVVRPIQYTPVEALRLHDTVIGPGGLARREALESAGGWDPSLRWMGDLILWVGIGLAGRALRVDAPLASWRRHPGSATISLGVEHAREHLRLIDRAEALEGMPRLGRSTRAEAVRNACLFAALFGGTGDSWPGDEFVIFDLHRKRISAASAGLDITRAVDWGRADRAAVAYRKLVQATVAGGRAIAATDPGPSGLDEAMRILVDVGAMPRPGGAYAEVADERSLRLALIEAAIACGADVDLAGARFVILDRRRLQVDQGRLDEVVGLGFAGSAEQIEAAQARGG